MFATVVLPEEEAEDEEHGRRLLIRRRESASDVDRPVDILTFKRDSRLRCAGVS
jgi:hypothetical protein